MDLDRLQFMVNIRHTLPFHTPPRFEQAFLAVDTPRKLLTIDFADKDPSSNHNKKLQTVSHRHPRTQ
jgi:hypothetical protein